MMKSYVSSAKWIRKLYLFIYIFTSLLVHLSGSKSKRDSGPSGTQLQRGGDEMWLAETERCEHLTVRPVCPVSLRRSKIKPREIWADKLPCGVGGSEGGERLLGSELWRRWNPRGEAPAELAALCSLKPLCVCGRAQPRLTDSAPRHRHCKCVCENIKKVCVICKCLAAFIKKTKTLLKLFPVQSFSLIWPALQVNARLKGNESLIDWLNN